MSKTNQGQYFSDPLVVIDDAKLIFSNCKEFVKEPFIDLYSKYHISFIDLYSKHLFMDLYSKHPFIDLYSKHPISIIDPYSKYPISIDLYSLLIQLLDTAKPW